MTFYKALGIIVLLTFNVSQGQVWAMAPCQMSYSHQQDYSIIEQISVEHHTSIVVISDGEDTCCYTECVCSVISSTIVFFDMESSNINLFYPEDVVSASTSLQPISIDTSLFRPPIQVQ